MKLILLTYQDAVKSRRGSSSLHMPQDCHPCVKPQPFYNKLGGYNEQVLADALAIYFCRSSDGKHYCKLDQ